MELWFFRQAGEFGKDGLDALFLRCTGLPTIALISWLEAVLGKPVVSSSPATMRKLNP